MMNECSNIGREKKWIRKCPDCNIDINYKNGVSYKRAIEKNTICLMCHNIHQKRYTDDIIKKCPKCNVEMHYTSKRNRNRSIKMNILCASCAQTGDKNPRYGIKWNNEYRQMMDEIFHRPEIYIKFFKKMPSTIGDKNPAKRPEVRTKISKSLKINCYAKGRFGENSLSYGLKRSDDSKLKMRLARINYIEKVKLNGGQMIPSFNFKACKYFDELSKKNGWVLQHAMNGDEYYIKELGYWVDGYDKERNIVVEYDEKHHYDVYGKLKERDYNRMKYIMEKLKCRFFRYNEITRELKEMNNIYMETDICQKL